MTVNFVYYDNRGDRVSVLNKQWAWDTRFWNLGATARLGRPAAPERRQVMRGRTWMGFPAPPACGST